MTHDDDGTADQAPEQAHQTPAPEQRAAPTPRPRW